MPTSRVEVHRGADRLYYWRRIAGNNRVTADSGEGYRRRFSARRAARKAFPEEPIHYV